MPAAEDSAEASQTSSGDTRHKCYLCSRTYERHDHLSRHLKSHDNERAYKCNECGKGFNRADLLNRHRAAHAKSTAGDVFRKRTPRACEACIKAKTKCEDDRPCKRCRTREISCVDTDARSVSLDDSTISSQNPAEANAPAQLTTPSSLTHVLSNGPTSNAGINDFAPFSIGQDDFVNAIPMSDYGYPDFFEQIMMPDLNSISQFHPQRPPDISHLTQDLNLDGLNFDFTFLASGLTRPSTPQGDNHALQETDAGTAPDVRLRTEAFNKSPWSWNHWIPERNHATFTGQEEINVRQDGINTDDQHVSPSIKRSVHCDLDHEARDRMIRVVTTVAQSKLAMPSFPSLQLLEDLIDIFLLQDSNAIDTFVHAASFSAKETRTELLLAMVAGGARYVALPTVWKMGLVIQEVVRLGVADVFESDNSSTRDLQPIQTSLIWVSVGIWSGFRRKTEIASSFLQPIVTMLTWANALTRARYSDISPSMEDNDEILHQKWRSWIQEETLKRVVLQTFLHDSQVGTTHLRNRLVSPSQLLLPVPMSLELWLAPNAQVWRNIWLARVRLAQSQLPSISELFTNPGKLDELSGLVDKRLCLLVVCHAFAHDVWQFRQQSVLLSNWEVQGRRDRWLTHQSRQRDIMDDLTTAQTYCEAQENIAPEVLFTIEFLIMSLHVSVEDILLFAGKSGEDEARKVYPRVKIWTQDAEARTAVWHAGQVLRVARTFEQTRLRDFYAVALYQASLTLWVYGMITSNTARRSGDKTPVPGQSASNATQGSRVVLDDDNDKAAKSFKLIGTGVAGLTSTNYGQVDLDHWNGRPNFCPLSNSKGVMLISRAILKGNFPDSRNGLPPLVENLVNLINELGNLSGK
ncbi:hypothetical protein CKM354_000167600 [Cercospora kikuchii]|uniref:Uncharacterized protein n=1 Tax=Cercospora kikuchii TaxID=84275 RepID=A0A9P3CD71_9PEZI|nr:uncharacterized protein CKM354_000167600 [Cercospora kikuchii]GIZ38255.1 hypothetical protein CKM354_000167600 [Cercospora kikuchii]